MIPTIALAVLSLWFVEVTTMLVALFVSRVPKRRVL